MFDALTIAELYALGSVVLIDITLAGDNAIVVGLAAAGLPKDQRVKVIVIGIAAATVLRIAFASVVTQLLAIIGLTLAGGILLLWVVWKMWREIEADRRHRRAIAEAARKHLSLAEAETRAEQAAAPKSFQSAVIQIVVADVSMSLDNVLAVAGAAREHAWVLIFGLALSVGLMGAAATVIARLLGRYHWIAYVGLAVIAYVAAAMIWEGGLDVIHAAQSAIG